MTNGGFLRIQEGELKRFVSSLHEKISKIIARMDKLEQRIKELEDERDNR